MRDTPHPRPHPDQIRLLFIEEHPARGQQLAEVLAGAGIEVIQQPSGEAGLKYLSQHPVDMLLCRLELPGRDGLAVMSAAKALYPALPVLIFSENGSIAAAVQAVKQGASNFFTWPLQPDNLIRTIRQSLPEQTVPGAPPPDPHLKIIKELERKAFALGRANIDMLAIQEKLEEQNRRLEQVLAERNKAQENLLLYRNIFLNATDPITILDKAGKILEVNPAAVKMFGYTLQELRGKTIAGFIGQDIYEEMLHGSTDKAFSGIRKELTVQTKNGPTVIVELSGFPIYSQEGEIIYRVGVARDITLRKQAQKALQKAHDELEIRVQERTAELKKANLELTLSEARHRALLNAIPDLMFRLNKEGIYIDYNAPKESDLALPPTEVIGRSIYETLPPELAKRALGLIHKTIATAEPQVLEYELAHEDHVHYFEARLVKSGPDEVISIVRDITERQIAEEALRKARDELEERVEERTAALAAANRELRETQIQLIQSEKMAALGTLVAGIAHEINTPVGAISSMHNTQVRAIEKMRHLLEERCEDGLTLNPQIGTILKVLDDANRVIATGSERVTTIVRRLRSFARLDEAELKEADIHEGIEDTLVLLQHEVKHHVQVVKSYGSLPKISCYPGKLNQVLLNLLINAKQAIQGEGTITIKTWHERGKVYIRVSDTGVGIPEKNLPKIFDPGFTTKGVGVGTGLGLSIVYRIIREDHQGDIRVESTVGKGTTFTIILPDDLDQRVAHT